MGDLRCCLDWKRMVKIAGASAVVKVDYSERR